MTEKGLEKKLREEVSRSGGLALKIASGYYTGLPDRLILMDSGRMFWVEMKSPGKDMTPRQKLVRKALERLGFDVTIIDSETGLLKFLKRIGA